MGGVWGLASSTALENLPVEARGLASGVLQQGYAVGYLISAVLNLYLVPKSSWRALFWTTSSISVFAATIRALTPESEVFLRAKAQQRAQGGSTGKKTKVFMHQVGAMLREHWVLCIYAILLMAGAWALQTHEEEKADYL
jgi:MFS transporter, SHS family, lactate transporter